MSAATLQLPVSIASTLRLYPVEVSNEPLASAVMLHNHIGEGMQERVQLTAEPKCRIKHLILHCHTTGEIGQV